MSTEVERDGENAIRVFTLSGTPYERGFQHGQQIGDMLADYWESAVRGLVGHPDRPISELELRAYIRERNRMALAVAPDLEQEIRGIADGGRVDFDVALGVASYVIGKDEEDPPLRSGRDVWRAITTGRARDQAHCCLGILIPAEYSTTGGCLLAETWDGNFGSKQVLLAVDEEHGRSIHFTDPGLVGGAGVNDRGLGSTHTGAPTFDLPSQGLPYSFIARRILQAGDIESSARSVLETPGTEGCHYTISDGERFIDVERAGATAAAIHSRSTIFATCSFFTEANCAAQMGVRGTGPFDWVPRYRAARVTQVAWESVPISPPDLFRILSDHVEGPNGWRSGTVCLHHPGVGHPYNGETQIEERSGGVVVVDPSNQTVWAKDDYPCSNAPIRQVTITSEGFDVRTLAGDDPGDDEQPADDVMSARHLARSH